MTRPNGVEYPRSGGIRIRLTEREVISGKDIALRKNRLYKKHQLHHLPLSDTIVALAFAKAQDDLFSFISVHLYDKYVWQRPDDRKWKWNAREEVNYGKDSGIHTGGNLMDYTSTPVVLGAVGKATHKLRVVRITHYLPAPWTEDDYKLQREHLLVPTSDLHHIEELLDALQEDK